MEALWGIVIDGEDGGTVAGATVTLQWCDADDFMNLDLDYAQQVRDLGTVTTGTDGTFRFVVEPARVHRIHVHAEGYAARTFDGRTGAREHHLELDQGSLLRGRVLLRGTGVSDASVQLIDIRLRVQSSVGTDRHGRFEFEALAPGVFWVNARANDHSEQIERLEIEAGRIHTLDMHLSAERAAIDGVVVDDVSGDPVSGALVATLGSRNQGVRSNPDGSFHLTGLREQQEHALQVRASGYAESAVSVVGPERHEFVRIRLVRGGSVVGRVVTRGAEDVPNRFVAAAAEYSLSPHLHTTHWLTGQVDESGRFRINDLVPGRSYWLLVRASGFGARTIPVTGEIDTRTAIDVGEIHLESEAFVEGTVRTPDGNPVSGQAVNLSQAPAVDHESVLAARTRPLHVQSRSRVTDAEGRFRFGGVGQGRWSVSAPSASGVGRRNLLVTAGDRIRDVELVLKQSATLSGRVIHPGGSAMLAGHSAFVCATGEGASFFTGRVDRDGTFSIEVPAGTYDLQVSRAPKGTACRPILHVTAPRSDITLHLGSGEFITGRVVDEIGRSVQATVQAISRGQRLWIASVDTTPDGAFSIEVHAGFRGRLVAGVRVNNLSSRTGARRDVTAGQTGVVIKLGER